MSAANVVLAIDGLEARYGRTTALRGVSCEIMRGETVCIVGPNGAGKSTILRCIAGGLHPSTGSIIFNERRIDKMAPEAIARMGVSFVPEGRHVFGGLTVEENLLIGRTAMPRGSVSFNLDRAYASFPRLAERRRQFAGKLSGGEQQMLAIARALMTQARLILIDEPSLGLAPAIIDQVYDILLSLQREEGLTLLINEQSFERVLNFSDRVLILREGVVQLKIERGQLRDEATLREAYFGF